MSYCVNCGVELEKTIDKCPLCATPVRNPNQPVDKVSPRPYPKNIAKFEPADKRETAWLLSIVLSAPSIACCLMNYLIFGKGMWSLYVVGVATIIWTWLVLPLIFHNMPKILAITLDATVVTMYVYIFAIQFGNNSHWFEHIAIPIIVLVAVTALFVIGIIDYFRPHILVTFMLLVAAVGVLCLGIETILQLHFDIQIRLTWSAVVAVSCVMIIVPINIIIRSPKLREEVRRRLHI